MYIDPGLGSLCIQSLVAFVVAFTAFSSRVRMFLFRGRKRKDKDPSAGGSEENGHDEQPH